MAGLNYTKQLYDL